MAFDMTATFRSDLPPADGVWNAPPPYSFVGGHNDAASVPFAGLAEAAATALSREGRNLATYNLGGSPLGYLPLREHLASSLGARAAMPCAPDEILITSGSLQALDLVNAAMLEQGDTVLVEQATYGGMLSRLARHGVDVVGVDLDDGGLRVDALEATLDKLAAAGTTPKYLYTIPTVQNPTGSVMDLDRRRALLDVARRRSLPIFEDECYADLTWGTSRPPTLRALDDGGGHVIYCGSFSKSIAPALRVGYIVADEPVLRQLLAMKTDAGTGALEQLTLAEFAPRHFDAHVAQLTSTLQAKCEVMVGALREHFGDRVEIIEPQGGIYVWVSFPPGTDTTALAPAAAAAGIEFNPGAGWSADPDDGRRRLRLCFGHPDHDTIRAGVAALAALMAEAA
ncbi:MAG: PLP-dependent aminotransferase family protein [Actinomycetota bacterium]